MSCQRAFQFIQTIRQNERLRAQIQQLDPAATLEDLVCMGAATGFAFTTADLQAAYQHDWTMRWLYYCAPHANA
jgi:predicted ribosomally synthesized peptide with nif11-like leader